MQLPVLAATRPNLVAGLGLAIKVDKEHFSAVLVSIAPALVIMGLKLLLPSTNNIYNPSTTIVILALPF